MATTVIGVFNKFEDAKVAVDRLAQDGIAREDVRVHSRDRDIGSWDDAMRAPPHIIRSMTRECTRKAELPSFSNFFWVEKARHRRKASFTKWFSAAARYLPSPSVTNPE